MFPNVVLSPAMEARELLRDVLSQAAIHDPDQFVRNFADRALTNFSYETARQCIPVLAWSPYRTRIFSALRECFELGGFDVTV